MSAKKKELPQPHEIVEKVLKEAGCEVWSDLDDTPFVTVRLGGHREHLPVFSADFTSFLVVGYLKASREFVAAGVPPTDAVLKSAQNRLRALAMENRVKHETHVRVAHHGKGVYYDLCDAGRRAVEVDASGYRVISSGAVPVRFVRPPGTLESPVPSQESDGKHWRSSVRSWASGGQTSSSSSLRRSRLLTRAVPTRSSCYAASGAPARAP